MLEHKVKNLPLPEDLYLFGIQVQSLSLLTKCCTNANFFKRLLDNDKFFLEKKFYFDQY